MNKRLKNISNIINKKILVIWNSTHIFIILNNTLSA